MEHKTVKEVCYGATLLTPSTQAVPRLIVPTAAKHHTATAIACQQMLKVGDLAPKHADQQVCKLLGRQRSGQSLPQGRLLSLSSTRLWSSLLRPLRQEQRADCAPH